MTPAAELYTLNEEEGNKLEVIDFGSMHRSMQGIEGFFIKNGIIEDKYNPEELLERSGKRFLQII